MYCYNCGAQLPDSARFCGYCGQAVRVARPGAPDTPAASPTAPANSPSYTAPAPPSYSPSSNYRSTRSAWEEPAVSPYNTTGLMIWSILSLLFGALIFGILALSNTIQINKSVTVEEQRKRIRNARIWCTVSTVIGALVILGQFAQNA